MGSEVDRCIDDDKPDVVGARTELTVSANNNEQVQNQDQQSNKMTTLATTTTTSIITNTNETPAIAEAETKAVTPISPSPPTNNNASIPITNTTTTATAATSDPMTEADKCCIKCERLSDELDKIEAEKKGFEEQLSALKNRLETVNNELEREVHRRCDLEQRFTEEAKRSTDQIGELIAKSDQDDAKLNDLKKRFELYSRETSSMIENFTTNREVLTSQLLDLRQENDYLLGKFIVKSTDLQNGEINLPQTVEELQFHCLTLNEKLILATLAKEQLEETLMQNPNH